MQKRFISRIQVKHSHIIGVFLFTLCLSFLFAYVSVESAVAQNKRLAEQLAVVQSGKIQSTIESQLHTAETLAAFVRHQNGDITGLNSVLKEVVKVRNVTNAAFAPDGVISMIEPFEENIAAMGHDVLHDPGRSTEANEAVVTRELTVSGPYHMRQGYYAIVGRQAVYLTDENGKDSFWGLVNITMRIPEDLKDAELDKISKEHYSYSLWRIDPDMNQKQIITKMGTIKNDYVSARIELPNSTWHLDISPANGWISNFSIFIRYLIAFLFTILVTALFIYTRSLSYSRKDLTTSMKQQSDNYHRMNELNEELRGFRHDMRNHMLSITSLLKDDKVVEATTYINNIRGDILTTPPITNTENYVFDAILAEKKQTAIDQGILFESEVYLSRQLKIDNMDWSILFGNLLDNAIEACLISSVTKPRIHVRVLNRGNLLHVQISNSAYTEPSKHDGTYKTTKHNPDLHGQGMKHIQYVIKKYNGTMDTEYHNHVFTISFMLINV